MIAGHILFAFIHLAAFAFAGFVGLFATVVVHVLMTILANLSQSTAPTRDDACPECKEAIMASALKCLHCGSDLRAHRQAQQRAREAAAATKAAKWHAAGERYAQLFKRKK